MSGHGANRGGASASPAISAAQNVRQPTGHRNGRPLPHIGYVRVSTTDQATNGISLKEQRQRLRAYAAAHGLELFRIASDNGKSGKTLSKRGGLLGALQDIEDGYAAGLIVCKLDRLSRTTTDILELLARADRRGWEFHSIQAHLDTSSANGRFVLTIMAGLAQMEREQTAERTRDALAVLRRQGKRISGRAPFGFRFEGDNVVRDEAEHEILDRMLALWESGYRARRIMRLLNADGWLHPRTGRAWTSSTIHGIIKNALKRAE
ncbi:MAG: recombinase family protein [Gemmatimonadales bacterium]